MANLSDLVLGTEHWYQVFGTEYKATETMGLHGKFKKTDHEHSHTLICTYMYTPYGYIYIEREAGRGNVQKLHWGGTATVSVRCVEQIGLGFLPPCLSMACIAFTKDVQSV